MHVESAAGRAEAADHSCGCIGLESCRNFAETELTGPQHQFLRERALPLPEQRHNFPGDCFHAGKPPGIFGASTARKNNMRSSNSPASSSAKASHPSVM